MSTLKQQRNGYGWRITGGVAVLAVLVIGIVYFALPHSQGSSDKNGLNVVAAENFWGDIASQLGGSHVHVTSIITDPGADPHLYESNPQNAAAVSSADVVIVNGVGYDDFMSKLLGASKSNREVLTVADILGVTDNGANPHLWYDIPRVSEVAAKITASYEAKDPANKDDYEHSLAAFNQSLNPLLQTISQIKRQYGSTPVAYTEPVAGYLLQAADLDVKTPQGFAKSIEDGDDPSPADSQTLDKLMTTKAVKILLYNSQATSPVTEHVKDLAKQAGVPVIGVSETLPPSEKNYQAWQQNQLDQLLKALETK
jgi:zinc/manganese transport system substrate-binding protein